MLISAGNCHESALLTGRHSFVSYIVLESWVTDVGGKGVVEGDHKFRARHERNVAVHQRGDHVGRRIIVVTLRREEAREAIVPNHGRGVAVQKDVLGFARPDMESSMLCIVVAFLVGDVNTGWSVETLPRPSALSGRKIASHIGKAAS